VVSGVISETEPTRVDHPREDVELDVDGIGVVDGQATVRDEVADENHRHAERDLHVRGHLRDRVRLGAQVEDARVLERHAGRLGHGRLHHRLDA
jgi:hypothetical protein